MRSVLPKTELRKVAEYPGRNSSSLLEYPPTLSAMLLS